MEGLTDEQVIAADHKAWQRRADLLLMTLRPLFAPRTVRLEYLDPFHASLLIMADDNSVIEVGRIAMDEPMQREDWRAASWADCE